MSSLPLTRVAHLVLSHTSVSLVIRMAFPVGELQDLIKPGLAPDQAVYIVLKSSLSSDFGPLRLVG